MAAVGTGHRPTLVGIPRGDASETRTPRSVLLGGRYRLIHTLGAGGMSVVHLGEHIRIGKRVAIKILADALVGERALTERFLREAQATARVRHPNVIEISDFGETDSGAPFFVMEYVEGEDLSSVLAREGPLPWPRAAAIATQIGQALAAAHAVGVVHRDLKPENCLCSEGRPLKVIDFGIAKLTGEHAAADRRLTQVGTVIGTPQYVAPEQARGEAVDHRADVYALGVIVFEMVTGRLPFESDDVMRVLSGHAYEAAPRFADVAPGLEVPAGVEAVVRRAMQKRPENRYANMAEFIAAIEAVGTGRAIAEVPDDAAGRPSLAGPMVFDHRHRGVEANDANHPNHANHPNDYRRRPRATVVAISIAVAATALAVLATLAIHHRDEPARAAPRQAALEAAPLLAEPIEPIEPAAAVTAAVTAAAEPQAVTVVVEANVDAEIVDPLDGARYGQTNDPLGFTLDRGDEAVALRLVAPGHADLDIELVPDRDRRYHHELEPIASLSKPTKRRRTPGSTPALGSPGPSTSAAADPSHAPAEPRVDDGDPNSPPPSADDQLLERHSEVKDPFAR